MIFGVGDPCGTQTYAPRLVRRIFTEKVVVFGDVATLAMLVIMATALILPRMPYEAFYMIHIVMFILIVITLCFHPAGPFALGSILVVICTAAFWLVDYMIRFLQLLRYSVGNSATVSPLPNGGLRVVMHKSPKNIVGGAHCSLWIPSVRLLETHPLAIVSTNPLEFVLASYDGFTGALYKASQQNTTLWASVHGPYGVAPDFNGCDKVVFIAGGSGASFTFGIAIELLRKVGDSAKPAIEFIWAVRNEESIAWYAKELRQLVASPLVNLTIHNSTLISGPPQTLPEMEKVTSVVSETLVSSETSSPRDSDVEKRPSSSEGILDLSDLKVKPGRPDIVKIIDNAVAEADLKDRLAFAVCGPEGLMKVARQTVAKNTKPEGPSIELQCEEYSW